MGSLGLDLKLKARWPLGGGSSLLDDLGWWYKMDETSGVRADSVGTGDDLVDNNTVLFTTGLIGNAARFVSANNEYLSLDISPSTLWADATAFTVSCWIYIDSGVQSNGNYFMEYRNAASAAALYLRYLAAGTTVEAGFYATNNGVRTTQVNVAGDLVDTAWNHIVLYYDPFQAPGGWIVANDGTPVSSAALPAPKRGASKVAYGSSAIPSLYQDYDLDLVGIWGDRQLTTDEITELYNGGSGVDYPFT